MSRWEDLGKRFFLSSLLIATIVLLLFFSQETWMRPILALTVLGLIGMATAELTFFYREKHEGLSLSWLVTGGISLGGAFFLSSQSVFFQMLPLFVFFSVVLGYFLQNFSHITGALDRISFSFFSLLYIALPLSLLFLVLYASDVEGRLWVAYLLAVTKMSDIGAYFGGKLLGKHLLAPSLSPKKTWEGATVGWIFSLLGSLFFAYLSMQHVRGFDLGWGKALLFGSLLSIFGQLGDLAESLLKRDANVKDSSCVPGLGGILDMVDSLLFSVPLFYLFFIFR